MTRSNQTEHDELRRIVDSLTRSGWTVVTEPEAGHAIPSEVQFRPDIVAFRGDEKLIGEVVKKSSIRTARVREMERISDLLPGWQVKVYYVDDDLQVPDIRDIELLLSEVDAISRVSPQAAFLRAWSALEMALRRLEQRYSVPPSRTKIPSLAALNSVGVTSDRTYERLTHFQRLRNQLAHMSPLMELSAGDVAELIEIARTLGSVEYRSPGELVDWFESHYEPIFLDNVSDPSVRSSALVGSESIVRTLVARFPKVSEIDAIEVAELLSSRSSAWRPMRSIGIDGK